MFLESLRSKKHVVVGHRGSMFLYAENTKISFDSAMAEGIFGIEFDLQLSKDGIPVVFHDRTLKKMGLPLRRVSGLFLSQLKQLRIIGDQHNQTMLSFEEVLSAYSSQSYLLIEIKVRGGLYKAYKRHTRLVDEAVRAVRKHMVSDKVAILCFYPEIIEYAKTIAPDLVFVQNISTQLQWEVAQPYLHLVDGICFNKACLSTEKIKVAQDNNKVTMAYSINSVEDFDLAVGCDVKIMLSDNPVWLSAFIRGKEE